MKVSHGVLIIGVFIQGRNACNYSIIWKHLLKLLLIAMVNGLLQTFADSFISFGGILYIPVDFLLLIFLKNCSALQAETSESGCFPLWDFLLCYFFYSFDTFMVSKRLKITSTAFLLSSISCSFATFVGLVPQERSTIFM